ncbi:hypothetical protein RGQ29_020843 [Quercus rubra]|uniref:DNA topoisomerase (ATP-hydrolyzing) n=1 Tax=Quercus rubra TaxID=3512 RepID=A0AAN7IQM3_QUERU|nr:hypothetical protein RGQ29_020843 [Quercus rubra]
MKPTFPPSSYPSTMAFSSGIRFSTLLLRHRPYSLLTAPTRFSSSSRLRHSLSDLRFLSTAASSSSKSVVKAARRSGDDDDGGGNGSVWVKGRVGNDDGGDRDGGGRIVPFELHKEATEAYMSYAMSVLLGRALPDVRDGLKPVHRRILFAMHELGLSSRKPFKKCARVVGEVLGKFHPHGDSAVYDSLVRMAQDFSLRCPLINGHGNFGSIDADPAAAMRYTECRLEALTEAMLLADLEQDTVDFVPNFDNSQKEPSLLPARLPTLLLNGASGIAVGMATNIPPHNLGELVDVLCALIHNPEATLQELLEYMPGPDFPTGGLIMGNIGILEAYRSGRGRVTVRGKTDVELLDSKTKRTAIIIKEVPYQTNKSALVEKIAELVENKSLDGISDIRDESDRSGMRIVIELKRGSDPSIVLNNLYRLTSLQSGFSCNMVGILDGQPKLMGLKELLQAFLDFRCSVVERRARFKLSQAQERRHIVEGIVVGLDNLDGVIRIIREASSNAIASVGLRNEFNLSEKQAEAILDISLRRLTLLEGKKFVDESKSLMEQISKLEELLSSKRHILQVIEQEAIELKNKFSSPRRSMLEDTDSGQLEDIDVIPNEEMLLVLSEKGYVKRMKPNTFNLQNRGTIGKSIGKLRVNDATSEFIVCRAHDHILYFSDKGIVYSARAYKIPECTRTAAGTPLVQILSISDGERITSVIPVSEFSGDQFLLMLTMNGYVKKVSLNSFSSIRSTGIIAIQLVPGDELKWVRCCTNDNLVAMASQNGLVNLCSCENFSAEDRLAAVFVVGFSLSDDGESDEQVVLVSQSGTVNRIKVRDVSIQSRYARGVILMRLDHAGKIQSASLISATEAEPEEEAQAAAVL